MPRFLIAATLLALGALATSSADAGWNFFSKHKKSYRYSYNCCSPCNGCGEIAPAGAPTPVPDGGHSAPAPQPYEDKPADPGPKAEAAPAPAAPAAPAPAAPAPEKKE
ncbi:MAG: hypothetical protein IT428_14720 [Planctomycetaceae bacterium]|nr:hypothetical protein [Planctomycetaceae bacterium]